MFIERQRDAAVIWAPAKVNLFLEVWAKRPDGYHDIATLMVAVTLYDTLEIKEGLTGELRIHCNDPHVPIDASNLIWRAAEALRRRTASQRGGVIELRKRIPMGAGLAGGSSDAAAALVALNDLWNLNLSTNDLAEVGAEVGSDVPFFVAGGGAAWCTGRGERLQCLRPDRPLWFALVWPAQGLSTAEVYRRVQVPAHPQDGGDLRQALACGDIEAVGTGLFNRLEPVAETLCPQLNGLKQRIGEARPVGQAMTGSGSAIFALCRDRPDAFRIANQLKAEKREGDSSGVCVVRSCI